MGQAIFSILFFKQKRQALHKLREMPVLFFYFFQKIALSAAPKIFSVEIFAWLGLKP